MNPHSLKIRLHLFYVFAGGLRQILSNSISSAINERIRHCTVSHLCAKEGIQLMICRLFSHCVGLVDDFSPCDDCLNL